MVSYDPIRKVFLVSVDDMSKVGLYLRLALRGIRELDALPLGRYERSGRLELADHVQRNVLEAAEYLGMTLGGRWGNEIDLSDMEENTDD